MTYWRGAQGPAATADLRGGMDGQPREAGAFVPRCRASVGRSCTDRSSCHGKRGWVLTMRKRRMARVVLGGGQARAGRAAGLGLIAALLFAAPAAAQPLQEALAAAYANNPTLQAARARMRATDENVPQALAGWRPTVTLQGRAGYADGTSTNTRAGTRLDTERGVLSGSATVIWRSNRFLSIWACSSRPTASPTAAPCRWLEGQSPSACCRRRWGSAARRRWPGR